MATGMNILLLCNLDYADDPILTHPLAAVCTIGRIRGVLQRAK